MRAAFAAGAEPADPLSVFEIGEHRGRLFLEVGVGHRPGVVDHRVDAAEGIERAGNDRGRPARGRHRLGRRDGSATTVHDQIGDLARLLRRDVVDDGCRAAAAVLEAVAATEAAPAAGHHHDLITKCEVVAERGYLGRRSVGSDPLCVHLSPPRPVE